MLGAGMSMRRGCAQHPLHAPHKLRRSPTRMPRSADSFPPFDRARAVVLFPSSDALDIEQLEAGSIDRAIIIDSKW